MLLSRHFVFIHLQKTGGTTVRSILEEHAPSDWGLTAVGEHPTYVDIPPSHAGLPIFAFVRNPFSWYVSWFHYQREVARRDLFLEFSDDGKLGFAETMRRMFASSSALELGDGPFLQYVWEALGPGLEGVSVGKMENMQQDLPRLIGECCEVPAAVAAAIDSLPVLNASAHDHYASYYDDELRDLIYQKDKLIFDYFDYSFEPEPS